MDKDMRYIIEGSKAYHSGVAEEDCPYVSHWWNTFWPMKWENHPKHKAIWWKCGWVTAKQGVKY